MYKNLMSSLAVGVSTVALAFTSVAHAGVADEPERALYASIQIASNLIKENKLSNDDSRQFKPVEQLADTLMKEVVAQLKSPTDTNNIIAYETPNPLGGTLGVAAVIPAKGLPPTTPIPVCLSSNKTPTSAWVIVQKTGELIKSKLVPNSSDQSSRPPCYGTLSVAKKSMDNIALAFTSVVHAGIADDPDRAFYSRVQISNTLVEENKLKGRAQFTPARELADTLMKEVVAGLKSPPPKNHAIFHFAANPVGGTYGVTAVIPAKGLPPTTPIPVCLSSNNTPTSAWVIIQATGELEKAKLVLNSTAQADRTPCYATIAAAKKEMDILLSQVQPLPVAAP